MGIAIMAVLLTVAASPSKLVLRDSVDLVELNHYHDEAGRHVFDQLIFYQWSDRVSRFQVRAWRLVKSPSQIPRRDYHRDRWQVLWHDTGVLREVTATAFRETWTQYDPELVEREYLPQEQRVELTRVAALRPDEAPPGDGRP